ncbi:MAG: hypothetical protein KME19_21585 [Microcoleus vaginatus WJT46-NPBG5]|nr:hypothetical protein [Microcoleus vaginatus WJT46-NPBG5]
MRSVYHTQPQLFHNLPISPSLLKIGHWALGIGHWALGIGHWALGMGQGFANLKVWALGIQNSLKLKTFPLFRCRC